MGKPHFRASLYHIDRALARLEPPWPDLILTVGRRPSMAALGSRRRRKAGQTGRGRSSQALARPLRSGDRTAAVPAPEPPQRAAHLDLPLMRVDEAAVATAATPGAPDRRGHWSRCRGRPDQAVCVRPDGRQAPDRPAAHRRGGGWTLYVTTSRRTPAAVVEAIAAALPSGAACTGGMPAATIPITRFLGWPTASSPATASR